jgi:hypothetical protein
MRAYRTLRTDLVLLPLELGHERAIALGGLAFRHQEPGIKPESLGMQARLAEGDPSGGGQTTRMKQQRPFQVRPELMTLTPRMTM